jgi:hypothetical protein
MTRYNLRRDGRTILTGTEIECWGYIHWNHAYSIEHALKYEGYTITPVTEDQQLDPNAEFVTAQRRQP